MEIDTQAVREDAEALKEESYESPRTVDVAHVAAMAEAHVQGVPYQELEAYAVARADYLAKICSQLRLRSIQATLPEDWVKMGDTYYLQDRGCQRAGSPWGIEFEKLNPSTDIVKEQLDDGRVGYLVSAVGYCRSLRIRRPDIGSRSTSNKFWLKQWTDHDTSATRRDQILADVRKASIANAYGRIVRALCGLNGVTAAELTRCGLDTAKCLSADYQQGGKGGARSGVATKPQLDFVYRLAVKQKRCPDLPPEADVIAVFKAAVEQQSAPYGKVKAYLDACKQDTTFGVEWAELVKILGNPKLGGEDE